MALHLNCIRYFQWTSILLTASEVLVKVPCATDFTVFPFIRLAILRDII